MPCAPDIRLDSDEFIVRPYHLADLNACLAVIDSTLPTYFTSEERDLFEHFLRHHALEPDRPFFVVEVCGQVRGCGGYRIDAYGVGYLAWGMVHADFHRQGLGTALLRHRLRAIEAIPHAWCVVMDTSQHTAPFYARAGFSTVRVLLDGYRPGLHKVYMRWLVPSKQEHEPPEAELS